MSQSVTSVSVSRLVRMRLKLSRDPWKLAVVQRAEVWDEYRAARLLDSLLSGYPIGTLLICRTREETAVLDLGEAAREHSVDRKSWQILDGQQRIIALAALFVGDDPAGEEGAKRRFFLNLSAPRPEIQVGKRDDRIHQYIVWQTEIDDPFEEDGSRPKRDRSEWFDLARLGQWLLGSDDRGAESDLPRSYESLMGWLRQVDPAFSTIPSDGAGRARDRLERLLACWNDRWIPVQKVELGGPYDVLQVFSRANMEGVRTSATDIFFAGVKTEWPAAEETLQAVCSKVRVLDRMHALRLLARLASYRRQDHDIIPLRLDRLKGEGGKALIHDMEELAGKSDLLERWASVSDDLIEIGQSGLGYGLHLIDRHLLDHVLGWVAGNVNSTSPSVGREDLKRLAEYLFWGSAFRLYPVLRDGFSRNAMAIAVERTGGEQETGFPLQSILNNVRETWPTLSYGRVAIPRPFRHSGTRDLARVRDTVHGRVHLFLAVAQEIPFDPHSLDPPRRVNWDHIYPRAGIREMKWHGPEGDWKLQYHPEKALVWRGGNLCLLDSSINKQLQDKLPNEKLGKIRQMRSDGKLWPPSLFITNTQAGLLSETHTFLSGTKDVPAAMKVFRQFIESRELRLWDSAVKKYPGVDVFHKLLFTGDHER